MADLGLPRPELFTNLTAICGLLFSRIRELGSIWRISLPTAHLRRALRGRTCRHAEIGRHEHSRRRGDYACLGIRGQQLHRIPATRLLRISVVYIGHYRCHQYRTFSWHISIPRSCSKSSTSRSEGGNQNFIITAKPMISEPLRKPLNGLGITIHGH